MVGPSARFRGVAEFQLERGRPVYAKLQIGTTHEDPNIPYLPVPHKLAWKYQGLPGAGVSGMITCWNFGNMLSLGTDVCNGFAWAPQEQDAEAGLRRVACCWFGAPAADQVVAAWRVLSDAQDGFPGSIPVMYSGPLSRGPAFCLEFDRIDKAFPNSWLLDADTRGDRLGWAACRRNARRRRMAMLRWLAGWSGILAVGCASALTVTVTSPRPGLLFTDSEKPDLRVRVTDAAGEVTVSWSAEETEGPWRGQGALNLPVRDGRGEAPLPLTLPGRGLFALTVTARCGESVARCETAVAVLFTPPKPDPASPFGIFFTPPAVPHPVYPGREGEAVALSHRLLGAAWSRLNFWAFTFGKVTIAQRDGKPYVTGDWARWKGYAKALRAEGISILGEISQCPTELSSQPDALDVTGDAGQRRQRVKPLNYAEWDSCMENLARNFRDEIDYWEIWNEANLRNAYWSGTPEELVELVHHTAAALRRGNPRAKIMGCGFVHDRSYADGVLKLGMGRDLDIFSVHYTDDQPGEVGAWRALLKEHGLALPIWNTEELSEVPLDNLAEGVVHSFKFMHINVGYDPYRLLVNPDFTCRPPAVWLSVGAHFLAGAQFVSQAEVAPGRRVWYFRRGDERLAVLRGGLVQSLFATRPAEAVIAAEPLAAGQPVRATTRMGRSTAVTLTSGQARLPIDSNLWFLSGARRIEVLRVEEPPGEGLHAEAEDGACSAGWQRSSRAGFSGSRILEIWSDTEPGAEGHWAEVKVTVPQAGRYEVLFAGNALSRLKPPRSVSPFAWRLDGGDERLADRATPMLIDIGGAPEGVSVLGQVELTAGEHTFRLRLTGRRDEPDTHYALWFDALALRAVKPGR